MNKRDKRRKLKKRNLAAKSAQSQPGAGPMKDRRRISRQDQRVEDETARRAQE
jgi:hypothetical protein